MKLLSIACIAATACAAAQSNTPTRSTTPDKSPVAAATYSCGDSVLADQATSGGLRIETWQPCWDLDEETQEHRSRVDLALETVDTKLAEVEQTACAAVGPREREHSPFAHRKEIAEVIPHRSSGQLAGVRVVFKPVAGLTSDWMRKAIACHRARWEAMGKSPTLAPTDPTLVEGAEATVIDRNGHIEVLVETETPEQAELALARAKGTTLPVMGSQSAIR